MSSNLVSAAPGVVRPIDRALSVWTLLIATSINEAILLILPSFVGALGDDLHLSAASVGLLGSSDLVGIALSTATGPWWVRRVRWKRTGVGALVAFLLVNTLCLGVTAFSLLMVLPDGENSIVTAGACAAAFSQEAASRFAANTEAGDLFLAQGNLTQETTLAGFKAARDCGAFTVFNPAPIWWDAAPLLAHCDILVVNRGEAEAISGLDDPRAAAARLHERGAKTTIITLGGDGCLVHSSGTTRHHEAIAVKVRDTTGCGDTFCGALCATLSLGHSLEKAIAYAQSAASITATRPGAFRALPSPAELSALCKTEA